MDWLAAVRSEVRPLPCGTPKMKTVSPALKLWFAFVSMRYLQSAV